jgi:hypothetical protein
MGHAHTPPELPEITDEAGDSPKWLPWLGVALFALGIGCVALCHGSHGDETGAAEADAAQEPAAP